MRKNCSKCEGRPARPASELLRLGLALALVCAWGGQAFAQVQPWPGEDWREATSLTELERGFRKNLSGAHWNAETRTLWVVCNGPARAWALERDAQGKWKVATRGGQRAKYKLSGDTEGITQADSSKSVVYVIDEKRKAIVGYDVSRGKSAQRLERWEIGGYLPQFSGGAGPEGIAFVPDQWLKAQGFVDAKGAARVSQRGMGGLMFVGHQEGGHLYVFDLEPGTSTFDFVGKYETAYKETSGLEFDRSTGELTIWHNTAGNVIEVSDLSSKAVSGGSRKLKALRLFKGPRGGNLEGIAFTPESSGEGWWWFTDDANRDGGALTWFQKVPSLRPQPGARSKPTEGKGEAPKEGGDSPEEPKRAQPGK